jgi:methylglutaconyl-CoA hydratase
MPFKNILYKEQDGIAEITLNRPEKMNSLDETLIAQLTQLFKDISSNNSIRVAVLTGAGGNFCSGLYLDYLQKISEYDLEQNREDSKKFRDLLLAVQNCSKPVIAKISGYALAGGCGLASACDIIIADETAKFGYTEVKIGFIPAIVMMFLLKRVSETLAKDLLLTARFISSDEAYRIGFINYSVKKEELDDKVKEVSDMLMKNSSSSIALTKEMFANISNMSFEAAVDYACEMNAKTRMTDDCKKGIAKFLERSKKK